MLLKTYNRIKEMKGGDKMKKINILVMILLVIGVMPFVAPAGVGGNLGGGVIVEDFEPIVWQCGERVLLDDEIQPWRISGAGSEQVCVEWSYSCNESLSWPGERECAIDSNCGLYPDLCCADHPNLLGCYETDTCLNYNTVATDREELIERNQQYLFEGERYEVEVVAFDKNKIDVVDLNLILSSEDECSYSCVYNATTQECYEDETCSPYFDDVEINCQELGSPTNFDSCNARIGEETIDVFDSQTMKAYKCTIDMLDSEHMYGIFTMGVSAYSSLTDLEGEYDEVARWFVNPIISLSVDGDLDFETNDGGAVRPGTSSYSNVFLENTAEGGVLLDMFITGKDWPSADSDPLARCWDGTQFVNYLPLSAFSYYTENGAYSTRDDLGNDNGYSSVVRTPAGTDSEGYVNINKQINAGFEEAMFDDAEIIQANAIDISSEPTAIANNIYFANLLYPGSVGMSLTFRLDLPEPCYGEFESGLDGSIFFWGEAI